MNVDSATSAPAPADERRELHFRRIDMRGYARADGLYEVEGRVTDRKPHVFHMPEHDSGLVPAGQPIHDMGVRLVFDEQMMVHDVYTFTDSSPYKVCVEGGAALQSLKGLRLSAGWGQEVRRLLGGERSCTHLRELLVPLATTAFQALSALRMDQPDRLNAQGRPVKIDSCYAYGAERELVRMRWPQFHRAAAADE